jgi:uncharacterized membrane protein
MDAWLFHPKLVHLPIALAMVMPLVSSILLLAWWRRWLPRRAWFLAVGLQALLVGSAVVALRTGAAEEDRVEAVVAERFIEAHEEAAEAFLWGSTAVLALMLASAALGGRVGLSLAAASALGACAVLGLAYRTGEAGGSLVYRYGAAQAYVVPGAPPRASPADAD